MDRSLASMEGRNLASIDRNLASIEDRSLLSFASIHQEDLAIPLDIVQEVPKGIWWDLRSEIEKIVKKGGIKKTDILRGEIEADVFKRAVDYIYDDVSEFYYWILPNALGGTDWRGEYIKRQKTFKGVGRMGLRAAVEAVVEDNLAAMKDAGELVEGGLEIEALTDSLTSYILNWQDWFSDRRVDDDEEAYDEFTSEDAEIYRYSDYGDLSNIAQ